MTAILITSIIVCKLSAKNLMLSFNIEVTLLASADSKTYPSHALVNSFTEPSKVSTCLLTND